MRITIPGKVSNCRGRSIEIVVRFTNHMDAPLLANPAEPFYRDSYGHVAVRSNVIQAEADTVSLTGIGLTIPNYALNFHAAQVNGLTGLAVTKLDVLDTLPELQVATAYRLSDGSLTESFPADTWSLSSVEPVYETLPGWQAPTSDVRRLQDLPANARAYLDRIEALTGAPVQWVSVGTRRRQIIPIG